MWRRTAVMVIGGGNRALSGGQHENTYRYVTGVRSEDTCYDDKRMV